MAVGDDEVKVRAERARAIGLFRYQLIREAADLAHSAKERGKMVRELASREHTDPFGRRVRISRQTIDRWIRDWRVGGFDALVAASAGPFHPATRFSNSAITSAGCTSPTTVMIERAGT